MQNNKPMTADRSPWQFLGAEIETMIAKHDGADITSSQVAALLAVAIEPQTLQIGLTEEKARPLAAAYAAALAANPDLAIKISQHVHHKWHSAEQPHSDLVWRFIATNPYAPKVRDNGKVRLDILTKDNFSDEEISRAIKKWCGKKIEASSIKTIRKRMPLPRQGLWITPELGAALSYLRTRGFCQHW